MKKIVLACIILVALLVPASVGAVERKSGDRIVIDTPLDDDLIAFGGSVIIDAQIHGDVFIFSGEIEINAPITGDLIAFGGQITVNDDIGGKIIAAGGMIDVKGEAEKVLAAGGVITFHSTAVIEKYVFAGGGTVSNAGEVKGDFYVATETFENTGTIRGDIVKEEPAPYAEEAQAVFSAIFNIMSILWKIGYFVLGIIFIKVFGGLFFTIQKEIKQSWLKDMGVGFLLILLTVAAFVVVLLLSVFFIGILLLPTALVTVMFFVMAAFVLPGIIVSYAFGEWLLKLGKVETHWAVYFAVGFIIMNLLFLIPYAGVIFRVVVASLGFGAIFYVVKNNWSTITAPA